MDPLRRLSAHCPPHHPSLPVQCRWWAVSHSMQRTFGSSDSNSTRRIGSLPLAIIRGRCEAALLTHHALFASIVPATRLCVAPELLLMCPLQRLSVHLVSLASSQLHGAAPLPRRFLEPGLSTHLPRCDSGLLPTLIPSALLHLYGDQIRVWRIDHPTDEPLGTLALPLPKGKASAHRLASSVRCTAISARMRYLACGCEDGSVAVAELCGHLPARAFDEVDAIVRDC